MGMFNEPKNKTQLIIYVILIVYLSEHLRRDLDYITNNHVSQEEHEDSLTR